MLSTSTGGDRPHRRTFWMWGSISRFSPSLSRGPSSGMRPWPGRFITGESAGRTSPAACPGSSRGWGRRPFWPTPWRSPRTPLSGPKAFRRLWPGWGLCPMPCRSILIFPGTATWPSAWGGCSAFTSWRTSTSPIALPLSPISGGGGISPCPPGSGITCISRLEATGSLTEGTCATSLPCGCLLASGTGPTGRFFCGGWGTSCC